MELSAGHGQPTFRSVAGMIINSAPYSLKYSDSDDKLWTLCQLALNHLTPADPFNLLPHHFLILYPSPTKLYWTFLSSRLSNKSLLGRYPNPLPTLSEQTHESISSHSDITTSNEVVAYAMWSLSTVIPSLRCISTSLFYYPHFETRKDKWSVIFSVHSTISGT